MLKKLDKTFFVFAQNAKQQNNSFLIKYSHLAFLELANKIKKGDKIQKGDKL